MNLFDFLKAKQYKEQILKLENKVDTLKKDFSDIEKMTVLELKQEMLNKKNQIRVFEIEEEKLEAEIARKKEELKKIESQLISAAEDIQMESFSLYKPNYSFATSLGYKDKLYDIRQLQKKMIKEKTAINYFENWVVEGSKSKGKKFTNDGIKQILRSFNNECEAAINKVKLSNIASIRKRIERAFEQLNKLNESNKLSITSAYLELKVQELNLAYEYEKKKEEEKEELREQREREREEKKVQKEIQDKKRVIDKDLSHYDQMIEELKTKLKNLTDESQKEKLNQEIETLLENIDIKKTEKEELDYREAHSAAGYVYIISNIGTFGEDVVKIGVTRRLNPYERITELSSASVPFKFDVHAMIFSYKAYQLEGTLHKKFEEKRINKVNMRKEFFNISINEIKDVLIEYEGLTIDFNEIPSAEEYRESNKIVRVLQE